MSNPSPYRALFSPVGMIGTVCQQIEADPKMPAPIQAQAGKVARLSDEAGDVICKSLTDATIRKMWRHGQEFAHACHRQGLIQPDATQEAPQLVMARLMAGHLAIDHHARQAKLHRYPLWRELERSGAALLDMLISRTPEHEQAAYAVAEEMCYVVTPTDRRKEKVRRKATIWRRF